MLGLKKIFHQEIGFITILLVLIVFVGALLRFITLENQSLWYDESLTWQESRLPFIYLIRSVNMWEGNPFFFPFIIRLISKISNSEFCLRFLPCLFGTFSIVAIYFLSKEFMSRKAALISALLLALSELQVVKSQEARSYSLVVLLSIITYYFYFKYFKLKKIRFLYYFLFSSLIFLFTHYSYAIIFLSFNILFALKNKEEVKSFLKPWVLTQLIIFCGISVVWNLNLRYQVQRFTVFHATSVSFLNQGFPGALSFREFTRLLIKNTFLMSNYFYARDYVIAALMFFLFIIGFLKLIRQKDHYQIASFLTIAILVNLALAFLGKYTYNASRHCIYWSPFYYLFVAKGTESLFGLPGKLKLNKILSGVVIGLIIYTGLVNVHRYLVSPGHTEIRELINYLSRNVRRDERIYIPLPVSYVFPYYYSNDFSLCLVGRIWGGSEQEALEIARDIDNKFQDTQHGWLIFLTQERPNLTLDSLSKQWRIDRVIQNPRGDVRLYHISRRN